MADRGHCGFSGNCVYEGGVRAERHPWRPPAPAVHSLPAATGVGSQAELIALDLSSQHFDVSPLPQLWGGFPSPRHPRSHGEPLGWGLAQLGGSVHPRGPGWGPSRCLDVVARLQPDAEEEACGSFPIERPENICGGVQGFALAGRCGCSCETQNWHLAAML